MLSCGEICTTSTVNISKIYKDNLIWFSLFRAFIFIIEIKYKLLLLMTCKG